MRFPWQESTKQEQRSERWLRWRLVAALIFVSAVPFVVVGSGAWIVFRNLAIEQTLTLHRTIARSHAAAIDMFLSEKLRTLEMITRTNTLEQILSDGKLREVFAAMGEVQQEGFVDLGVIDGQGRHRAYVGPYDLRDRNYADAEWFRAVVTHGYIVSDVFLGYRQLPHSVIAVRQQDASGWWILRATIDSRGLDALVQSLEVGTSGDVFIVNQEGVYQTPPKVGSVLEQSGLVVPSLYQGVREQRLRTSAGMMLQVTTWLNGGQWLLAVQQPEGEILAPVNRAVGLGAAIAVAALALVVLAIVLVTSYLTGRVERANEQRDLMYADLLRSAKLASLGEMATGLAHEINNPLATISAEQTNLGDIIAELGMPPDARAALEKSIERSQRQIARCGGITAKMLQFGRKTDTDLKATDVEPVLREITALLERRARLRNATLTLEVEPNLPSAWLDPNELEQVLVNLVNNAIDALRGDGTITIAAGRSGDHVLLRVTDDGVGVRPGDLERIFQPFFTTKPVGQGTGLGLSVVYGIVRGWSGTIDVESVVDQGTTITIRIPMAEAPEGAVAETPG